MESDHHPVIVKIERQEDKRGGQKQGKNRKVRGENWTEEERKEFQKKLEKRPVRGAEMEEE